MSSGGYGGLRENDERSAPVQQQIVTNLWFDTEAEDAANHYCSIFPSSRIVNVARYTEGGMGATGLALAVEFELDGTRLVGINGGPQFTFSEAMSLQVLCDTQAEVDHYRAA
jgi:predicted 3-demethylubiquinone-9 3-methyltransferase (glyoxalase superfamily)